MIGHSIMEGKILKILLRMHIGLILFLMLMLNAAESRSQTTSLSGSGRADETLRVFIDCENCDISFIRNTLTFVDHVRDPRAAQIHILITDQETAGG